MSRIAATVAISGLVVAGFATPAFAQDLAGVVNGVPQAVSEVLPGSTNTAVHNWKNSNVTRTIEVNGKAGAVAKPGDILTFTLTYTDNNIWGFKSYIQRVTDFKPAGLTYVANSATYSEGDGPWAPTNEADKWFRIKDGAVEFHAGIIFSAFGGPATSKVSFKWQYRVTDEIADGNYDTGTEIHFNPGNKVEPLRDIGPKLTIQRPASVLPGGTSGAAGSPSLSSPGLASPNLTSPGLPSPGIGGSAGSPSLPDPASFFKAPGK